MLRPIVLENGKLRQLRDDEQLLNVQRFVEGNNISFSTNPVTGRITISATATGGGGSSSLGNLDGGGANTMYGGMEIIDGGGI